MRFVFIPPLAAFILLAACGSQDGVTAKNASPEFIATKAAAGHNQPEPGRWRWTATIEKMEIPGLSPEEREALSKPTTWFTCVTAEQANGPHIEAFQKGRAGCTYDHFSLSRGVLNAGLSCTEGGRQYKGVMTGSYSTSDYQIRTSAPLEVRAGLTGDATKALEGIKVGECDGTEAK